MNESDQESIRRVFTEVFSVRDIAEPLVSFDSTTPASEVLAQMQEQGFVIVGARRAGRVVGYVAQEDLADEVAEDNGEYRIREFGESETIRDTAPLSEAVLGLEASPRLFVTILGSVCGIVTKSDLQKPAVRMWLFGMVTLIETRLTQVIGRKCPDDSWKQYLSPGRFQKAEALQAERARRGQEVDLVECLQLSDKGTIFSRNKELLATTPFESRRRLEEAFKGVERLRNNLAHSQDIISGDLDIISRLAGNLDGIIRGPKVLRNENDLS